MRRVVIRRQETHGHVGRQTGLRIDRLEGGVNLARVGADAGLDLHLDRMAVHGHIDGRFVVLPMGGHGDVDAAETDFRQLEGVGIEVLVQRIGDLPHCTGAVAVGSFSNRISYAESDSRAMKCCTAYAARADQFVWVDGIDKIERFTINPPRRVANGFPNTICRSGSGVNRRVDSILGLPSQ